MSSLFEDLDGVQRLRTEHGGPLTDVVTEVTTVPFTTDSTAFVNINTTRSMRGPVAPGRTRDVSGEHHSVFVPSAAVARKLGEQFMRLSEQLGYAEDGES